LARRATKAKTEDRRKRCWTVSLKPTLALSFMLMCRAVVDAVVVVSIRALVCCSDLRVGHPRQKLHVVMHDRLHVMLFLICVGLVYVSLS